MYIVSSANHHNTEVLCRAANTIEKARVLLLDAFLKSLKARGVVLGEAGFPEPPKAGETFECFYHRRRVPRLKARRRQAWVNATASYSSVSF